MARHAGYRVGFHAADALALARAELAGQRAGLEFTWAPDADGDLGDHAYWCPNARRDAAVLAHAGIGPMSHCRHEVEWCAAWLGGHIVASLGGIIDASADYRRVVEAELALDAVGTRIAGAA